MGNKLGVVAFTLALVATAGILSACESETTSDSTSTTAGSDVRKTIRAAEGGEVADAKGEVKLVIPPGALAEDTEITLAVRAAEAGSQSGVYDFGPDGTKFAKPASIAIKLAGAPPEGKKAVVAVLEGATWKPLAGKGADGSVVTGDVEHFSKFAIVFVDGQVVAQSACGDVVKNFTACGGDPKGTWKYRDICTNVAIGSADNPFTQICPDAKFEAEVTIEGTVTIDASQVVSSPQKTTSTSIAKLPKSCYGALQATTCTEVGARLQLTSCAEEGEVCVCKGSETNDEPAKTEAYTIDGNTLKVGTSAVAYCVKGDTLELEALDDETQKRQGVMVLEKQ